VRRKTEGKIKRKEEKEKNKKISKELREILIERFKNLSTEVQVSLLKKATKENKINY
jgi:hypothetical protein